MSPLQFFKCLSEDTRLKSLLLISEFGEVCVCELMEALALDQPKISRHLAELRKYSVVLDNRRGKWVYYQLHPDLPAWAKAVINQSASHNQAYFAAALKKLKAAKVANASCS